jgi:hypothetical protein
MLVPSAPSCYHLTATATGPLYKQLLLVGSYGLIEQAAYLLCHALSLGIALDIDDPT